MTADILHEFMRFKLNKHKVRTITAAVQQPWFAYLKVKTGGYLSPNVYRAMYDFALEAPKGHIIDIGPAQGGSSICYAKALQNRKETDYYVYSIEKGHTSNALKNNTNVASNQQVLQSNFKKFGVPEKIDLRMTYSHEAFTNELIPNPIALLSIDADGAIDRDINLFFNNLTHGGIVVFDDYEDIVNRHGERLLNMSENEIHDFLNSEGFSSLKSYTPLGKEYSTYRFVNYLIDEGFLEKISVVGQNTLFTRKKFDAPDFTPKNIESMLNIRNEIVREFYEKKQ
jgi:hypothetical protein